MVLHETLGSPVAGAIETAGAWLSQTFNLEKGGGR